MRLLHVSHYFRTELEGGVQSYVAGLVERQVASPGIESVEVVSGAMRLADGAPRVRTQTHAGARVTTIERTPDERLAGDLGGPRLGGEIANVLERFAPDLVHVHHWHALTDDIVRRCRAAGARVVVTLHDFFTTCPRFFRVRPGAAVRCAPDLPLSECAVCVADDLGELTPTEIERVLVARHGSLQDELSAADAVTTMSAYMRDTLRAIPFFGRDDVRVLPIGVMHEDLDPVAPPAPEPGRLRIAHWAGLDPRKGCDLLLRALAGSAHPERFEVHVLGATDDPVYRETLRRAAGDRLPVVWHGRFSGVRPLSEIAASCDLAVFPSLEEPYGLAQDEAMLLGMALVVSDRGAPPERVGGRALVVPAEEEALRDALDGLRRAPDRIAAMRAAPCRPNRLDEHVVKLRALYDEVSNGR